MDIKPTATMSTSSTDYYQSSSATQKADDTKKFQDELDSVKASDEKAAQQVVQQKTDEKNTQTVQEKTTEEKNIAVQKQKEADLQKQKDVKNKDEVTDAQKKEAQTKETLFNQLFQLKTEISNVKEAKTNSASKTKFGESGLETKLNYKTMKMDSNDALFFANMVKNQQLGQQNGVQNNLNGTNVPKTEGVEKSMQVSATLMDSLNESMKTNKPLRIDFDKDIAVILKVDKQGKISADFIPGDKAVETYLKNNISSLQQSFEEQNIPYSNLSYQKQKQNQEDRQENSNNRKNKENDDE